MSNLPDDLEGELVARNGRQALFEEIWDQMYRLHTNWRLYSTLFGDRQAVDVLLRSAIITFGAIQHLVREAIILGIQRLLDPGSGNRGRKTASIESLLALMPPTDAPLRRRLRKDLDRLRRDCDDISKWRHRRIAHRDLSTALEEHPEPLEPIKIQTVWTALNGLSAMLGTFSAHYQLGMSCDFEGAITDLDADELLRRLAESKP